MTLTNLPVRPTTARHVMEDTVLDFTMLIWSGSVTVLLAAVIGSLNAGRRARKPAVVRIVTRTDRSVWHSRTE